MPSLAELLKAEGVEVTPELESKLPTLTEASDEVRNLVTAKDDLLKWKQENSEKVTGYDEIQTKYEQELNEKEQLAIQNNDFKTQIEIRDERAKKQEERLKLRNDEAKKAKQDSVELEIANLFSCKETGRDLAKNFAKTEIGEDGVITTTYDLKGERYSDFDSFKHAASKVEYLAKQMAVPDNKGPQGNGGSGGFAGKKPKDMTSAERLEFKKNDPEGFKKAFNLN